MQRLRIFCKHPDGYEKTKLEEKILNIIQNIASPILRLPVKRVNQDWEDFQEKWRENIVL